MAAQKSYRVVFTKPAQERYRHQILAYVQANFSAARQQEIDAAFFRAAHSLQDFPNRGTPEPLLYEREFLYRFILHRESRNLEVKIIYYVGEAERTVYVTDFFPVRMAPDRMGKS